MKSCNSSESYNYHCSIISPFMPFWVVAINVMKEMVFEVFVIFFHCSLYIRTHALDSFSSGIWRPLKYFKLFKVILFLDLTSVLGVWRYRGTLYFHLQKSCQHEWILNRIQPHCFCYDYCYDLETHRNSWDWLDLEIRFPTQLWHSYSLLWRRKIPNYPSRFLKHSKLFALIIMAI